MSSMKRNKCNRYHLDTTSERRKQIDINYNESVGKHLAATWVPPPKDVRHDEDDAKVPASDAWLRETQAMSSMKTEQRKHSYCTTELRKEHSIQACMSKQPAHNATSTSLVWARCNHIRCPLMSLLRAACRSFQMWCDVCWLQAVVSFLYIVSSKCAVMCAGYGFIAVWVHDMWHFSPTANIEPQNRKVTDNAAI